MMLRAFLTVWVLFVLPLEQAVPGVARESDEPQVRSMSVEAGKVPMYPALFSNMEGTVGLSVTAVSPSRTDAHVLSAHPALLGPFATDAVESWRFLNAPRNPFQINVQYRLEGTPSCASLQNSRVRIEPFKADVIRRPQAVCEQKVERHQEIFRTRVIAGRIECNCKRADLVAGIRINIEADSPSRRPVRTILTDSDGFFRADSLPEGRYDVLVAGPHLVSTAFSVDVSPTHHPAQLSFSVSEKAEEVRDGAVVVAADMPAYPADARARAQEGSVTVRFSFEQNRPIDINVEGATPSLVEATRSNARTWLFTDVRVPVLIVTYKYQLVETDCNQQRQPTIDLDFPKLVTLSFPRYRRCGMN